MKYVSLSQALDNLQNKISKKDIRSKPFITAVEQTFAELFWIGQNQNIFSDGRLKRFVSIETQEFATHWALNGGSTYNFRHGRVFFERLVRSTSFLLRK